MPVFKLTCALNTSFQLGFALLEEHVVQVFLFVCTCVWFNMYYSSNHVLYKYKSLGSHMLTNTHNNFDTTPPFLSTHRIPGILCRLLYPSFKHRAYVYVHLHKETLKHLLSYTVTSTFTQIFVKPPSFTKFIYFSHFFILSTSPHHLQAIS